MADNNNQGLPPLMSNTDENQGGLTRGADDSMFTPTIKDVTIAGGVFLGLMIVFIFVRNAFTNYLVGTHKRSPNSAGVAGWGLFGGLLCLDLICSIALVNSDYLTTMIVIPISIISMISFLASVYISMRK